MEVHNGKGTIIAMMRTTIQDVNGMVVIAVETTSEPNTVINANVWTLILMEQLEIVKICKPAVLIGLEKAIVPKPTFHT